MAITFLTLSERLKGIAGYLEGPEHGNVMVKMANEALSLNKQRVQQQGENPEGLKYTPYTPKYKKYKESRGSQFYTGFVDFTLSGRMWNNIKLVSDRSELNSGVAVIKATEDLQKKKLAGNTEKRGDILGLSKKEEERLSDIYEVWVQGAIRKFKL